MDMYLNNVQGWIAGYLINVPEREVRSAVTTDDKIESI
jgi:hypothetical protein